ncbi:hypothetical protein HB948_12775 [Listeria welshimeri]|nr:hypothetical protein [Listeria welshimeri]MBC2302047.1 hypothetical protein [Listeria welshimeri]
MGIFEDRSIVLDENIVNVKEWLTPEEAITIFISAGYQLELKEEYQYINNSMSISSRELSSDSENYINHDDSYILTQLNLKNVDFAKAVLEGDKSEDVYKRSKVNKVDLKTLQGAA